MKLKALLRGLEVTVKGSKEIEISGLSSDSKTTAPGHLFLARKGGAFDGSQFIPQAIRSGAVAILTDLYDPSLAQTQIIVENPGDWEAVLAARFYGFAARELYVAGVTGSKGKTTTCYMVRHVLGELAGLISTVETRILSEQQPSSFTTHFPIQNQRILREMVVKGCKEAVLEISSHGLEQNRIGEIDLDAALFTNLYPDHLDFHNSVEAYAKAKRMIFERLNESKKKDKRALLNADSEWAPFMKEVIRTPLWTYGIESNADILASKIRPYLGGTAFQVSFQGQIKAFELPLIGRFNVYNALGAIGAALARGVQLDAIAEKLAAFSSVPGRLERIASETGITVFIDFAHTGEALEHALQTVREFGSGRVICVFGCGGDRDPGRRKGMGEAARRFADYSILTSDNPRTEDPEAILAQIASCFPSSEKYEKQSDRKEAIGRAIALAQPGDCVLIAGKGHEKVQIFAHRTIAFDDVEIAKEALQKS